MPYDGKDRRAKTTIEVDAELVVRMDERLNQLHEFLTDNGQPGAITKLANDIEKVRTESRETHGEIFERISRLERWKSYVNGGFAVVSGLATIIGGWFTFSGKSSG